MRELDCDFYAFSGHKIYGPTGIGVLYGKAELLEAMPPYQGGGDMISSVTFEKTTYNELPYKFEAGTPNIAGAIGLGAAIDYVSGDRPGRHRRATSTSCSTTPRAPSDRDSRRAPHRHGAREGRRACRSSSKASIRTTSARSSTARASPSAPATTAPSRVMERFGVPATARASFALYNTKEEMDALVAGLQKVAEVFR